MEKASRLLCTIKFQTQFAAHALRILERQMIPRPCLAAEDSPSARRGGHTGQPDQRRSPSFSRSASSVIMTIFPARMLARMDSMLENGGVGRTWERSETLYRYAYGFGKRYVWGGGWDGVTGHAHSLGQGEFFEHAGRKRVYIDSLKKWPFSVLLVRHRAGGECSSWRRVQPALP